VRFYGQWCGQCCGVAEFFADNVAELRTSRKELQNIVRSLGFYGGNTHVNRYGGIVRELAQYIWRFTEKVADFTEIFADFTDIFTNIFAEKLKST
jgi:hypothetical protein